MSFWILLDLFLGTKKGLKRTLAEVGSKHQEKQYMTFQHVNNLSRVWCFLSLQLVDLRPNMSSFAQSKPVFLDRATAAGLEPRHRVGDNSREKRYQNNLKPQQNLSGHNNNHTPFHPRRTPCSGSSSRYCRVRRRNSLGCVVLDGIFGPSNEPSGCILWQLPTGTITA